MGHSYWFPSSNREEPAAISQSTAHQHVAFGRASNRSLRTPLTDVEDSTYLGPRKPTTTQFSYPDGVNWSAASRTSYPLRGVRDGRTASKETDPLRLAILCSGDGP